MTGAYVRVQRDGKWQSIEIDQLTQEEIEAVFADAEKERIIRWVVFLVEWMQRNSLEGPQE